MILWTWTLCRGKEEWWRDIFFLLFFVWFFGFLILWQVRLNATGFLVDDGEKNKIHSLWQYGYCLIGAVPLNPSLALLKAFAQYFQYLFNDWCEEVLYLDVIQCDHHICNDNSAKFQFSWSGCGSAAYWAAVQVVMTNKIWCLSSASILNTPDLQCTFGVLKCAVS